MPLINCGTVLIAEDGNGDGRLRSLPSSSTLAFENFTVHRASRSFCLSFADLSFQASGSLPASAFSSSVFPCFGAATIVASTIYPPMAR